MSRTDEKWKGNPHYKQHRSFSLERLFDRWKLTRRHRNCWLTSSCHVMSCHKRASPSILVCQFHCQISTMFETFSVAAPNYCTLSSFFSRRPLQSWLAKSKASFIFSSFPPDVVPWGTYCVKLANHPRSHAILIKTLFSPYFDAKQFAFVVFPSCYNPATTWAWYWVMFATLEKGCKDWKQVPRNYEIHWRFRAFHCVEQPVVNTLIIATNQIRHFSVNIHSFIRNYGLSGGSS